MRDNESDEEVRFVSIQKGLFVAVDGPNGVGKSCFVEALMQGLANRRIKSQATAEPTASPIGKLIRGGEDEYRGNTLACLVAADRYFHIEREILPALQNGKVIVSSRYLASSLVYQQLDNVNLNLIWAMNNETVKPDLSVILTASPAILEERLARRPSLQWFERTIHPSLELNTYLDAAKFLENNDYRVWVLDNGETPLQSNINRVMGFIVAHLDMQHTCR